MNSIKFYPVVFILSIFIVSCTFEPDELKMEQVRPLTEVPRISIDLNNLSPFDTIVTRYSEVYLGLTTYTSGKRIIEFSMQRGTNEPYVYDAIPNHLHFELYHLQEGLNQFNLRMIVGSGTNSLADQLDSEGYITEFPFSIFKVPEYTYDIASISDSVEDGRLKIHWAKYPYPDFQAYIVNGIRITDQDVTSLIDSNYIEQHQHYHEIEIMASERIVSRDAYTTRFGIPKFTVEPRDNHIQITWEKTKFFKRFNKYAIFIPDFPQGNNNFELFETNDINETSAISYSSPFGCKFNVDIQYLAENEALGEGYSIYQSKVLVKDVEIGELSPDLEANTIIVNPQSKAIMVYDADNQTVSFLDEDQNALLNTTQLGINERIIYSQNGTHWGLSSRYDIKSFDPATFESTHLSNFKYLIDDLGPQYGLRSSAIDGNGIFYLSFVPYENYNLQYEKSRSYKFNPQTGIVSELAVGNSPDYSLLILQVSEDGLFALCKSNANSFKNASLVYSINDNLLEKISDIEMLRFLPLENQILGKSFDGNKSSLGITIYNLPALNIETEYQLETISEGNFSPLMDYVMIDDKAIARNAKCHIVEVKTGKVLTTVLGFPRYIISGKYVYRNNRRMKLEY